MALVVEDGTGVENATAYADPFHASIYHSERGTVDYWLAVEEAGAVDGLLVDATRLLEHSYRWLGTILTVEQGLGLPRDDITLPDGRTLGGQAQVAIAADAVSHLALELWRDRPPADGMVKRSESLPDYSVTYDVEQSKTYPEVDRILAPLVDSGGLGGGMRGAKLARWS